ncbi:Protein CBG15060 [Caenorhabditis briggsae]|uniref:Protein CBG15060 n=1 Tax=Caenorhabditis briggsae TaxID=6238 RepID=A8XLB0_CAEBR|nr:Protein CBG15060 [Caenorhabditis briggsae]CAP33435.2 Protein CBG15060 [Caenorhabditis briggsae]
MLECQRPAGPGRRFLAPGCFRTRKQNQAALQALISGNTNGENPSIALARLFQSLNPAGTGKSETSSPGGEGTKKARLKVFSNGYFMTFDKISSCRKKHFWRCEYKNTCKARMHTDIESEKIVTYIHDHNHTPPTAEEIQLYGIDPQEIERNRVYIVGNVSDTNLRRKIRKQVADREAAAKRLEQQQKEELQKKQNEATMAAAQEAYARAVVSTGHLNSTGPMAAAASLFQSAAAAAAAAVGTSSAPTTTQTTINPHALLLAAQLPTLTNMIKNETTAVYVPNYISPNMPNPFPPSQKSSHFHENFQFQPMQSATPSTSTIPPLIIPKTEPLETTSSQPSAKRRAIDTFDDAHEVTSHPNFEPTFQIAHSLRKLWRGTPGRYPRPTNGPSPAHFEFYIAKYDGAEEHLYVPCRIEQRDEAHMREALQQFAGEQCHGMLLFKVSSRISVVLNQPMLITWANNQFFLLDTSNPSKWKFMYVDDQAM